MFKSIFIFLIILALSVSAQNLTPRPSPNAKITQTVGVTDVTIAYSRPGVKDRTIWGELVPYNKLWRTGANEATTLEISTNGKIEGKEVSAGKYSLFTIPGKDEWTVILNKDTEAGTGNYDQSKDVMRFSVKPVKNEFVERMTFDFENITDNSADIVLKWENLKIPFKVEFKTPELVMQVINDNLKWGVANTGATYLLQNGTDLEKAMELADLSIMMNENYWNLRIKAQILEKMGKKKEAIATLEKAIDLGSKMKDKPFDYEGMQKLLKEWKA